MKYLYAVFLTLFMLTSLISCAQKSKARKAIKAQRDLSMYSKATFASGCFWCVEGVFESVKGVEEAVSGYSGGKELNPTYEKVSADATGHAEAVQVYYDPKVVSYSTLVQVYFASQDPTQVNGQGPDKGAAYRSIIFFNNAGEKATAEKYIASIQKNFTKPVAAEVKSFEKFWPAETYHQDYIKHNPDVPYVRGESIPRIKRFQAKHPEFIKPDHKL